MQDPPTQPPGCQGARQATPRLAKAVCLLFYLILFVLTPWSALAPPLSAGYAAVDSSFPVIAFSLGSGSTSYFLVLLGPSWPLTLCRFLLDGTSLGSVLYCPLHLHQLPWLRLSLTVLTVINGLMNPKCVSLLTSSPAWLLHHSLRISKIKLSVLFPPI